MSSIEGILVSILLLQNGTILHERPVDLFLAEVLFFDLPIGSYEVVAVHPRVNPPQVQQRIQITSQTVVFGLRFIYSEPERQLLRVEISEYKSDG